MMSKKISKKNINENWVEKTMNIRFKKPIYITSFIVLLIIFYYVYEEYAVIADLQNKQEVVLKKIDDNKKRLNAISSLINKQTDSIISSKSMILDVKKASMYLKKVCDLLKNKEIIGSYYISKKYSKEYKNVTILSVKISYGDKQMLKTIANLLLDKLFYVKKIYVTKTGIECELYKRIK